MQRSERACFPLQAENTHWNTNDYIKYKTWPFILVPLGNKHRLRWITIPHYSSIEYSHKVLTEFKHIFIIIPNTSTRILFYVSNSVLNHLNKCSRENVCWIWGGKTLYTICKFLDHIKNVRSNLENYWA